MEKLGNLFFILVIGIFWGTLADVAIAQNISQRFSEFDPNSTIKINHSPLTGYLADTVLPVGRSYRIMGDEAPDSYRGSRIKTSKSLSPSRYEGSRIMIHAFSEDHKAFFRGYQKGLENLSNRRPLQDLNKSEQLAFWLNLYNVIVINKLVEEYPISNLKSFRSAKRGKTSFWDEKVTMVEGVPLSLKDIEAILFANFNKPEVAFGLWQGSIGGPRLANYAYTGANVWRALETNATEFVNSNRGLRSPTGTRMNVSDFYEWVKPAFGTSDDHVLMFIKSYVDPNFVSGVESVNSINFKIYDWTVADILGGNKHSGTDNQLGGVLTGKSNNFGANPKAAPAGDGGGGGSFGGLKTAYDFAKGKEQLSIPGIPESALPLILGIAQNSHRPIPIITTTECAPGEICTVENVNSDDGPR